MREMRYISGVVGVLPVVFILHICRFKGLHSECYPTAQREAIYIVQTTASVPSGTANSAPMQLPADCNLYHLHCTTAQLHYCEH